MRGVCDSTADRRVVHLLTLLLTPSTRPTLQALRRFEDEVFQASGQWNLPVLPACLEVQASSADGSIVVGTASDEAFRWTQEEDMQSLTGSPGYSATRISANGSVIVASAPILMG